MGNKDKLKTHFKENNLDSERHLHENELKFSNQCKKVLSLLRQGVVLTTKIANAQYDIGDLHRRIGNLRDDNKVEGIVDEWVHDEEGKTKYKKWYMPEFVKSTKLKPTGVKAPVEAKEPKPAKKKNLPPVNQQPFF